MSQVDLDEIRSRYPWFRDQRPTTPLTPHERRLLELLAVGLHGPAIARFLGVTYDNVKTQTASAKDRKSVV